MRSMRSLAVIFNIESLDPEQADAGPKDKPQTTDIKLQIVERPNCRGR